jgi:hypothetical protein
MNTNLFVSNATTEEAKQPLSAINKDTLSSAIHFIQTCLGDKKKAFDIFLEALDMYAQCSLSNSDKTPHITDEYVVVKQNKLNSFIDFSKVLLTKNQLQVLQARFQLHTLPLQNIK